MKKEQFVYIPKIDSGKISIQLDRVKILKESIVVNMSRLYMIDDTGEILDDETEKISGKPHIFTDKKTGVYVKVFVQPQINYVKGQAISERYLTVLINSKHLGKDYFKGITKETFKDLYDNIMSWKLFHCSFDDFKNARYSDIDICFDFICNKPTYLVLKENILNSVKDRKVWHSYKLKGNTGLTAPSKKDPRGQAKIHKPYVKFYDKDLDMKTRSNNFYKEYLNDIDTSDLIRYECTLRNGSRTRYGIKEAKTFWELLDCDLRDLQSKMFQEYFDDIKQVNTDLTFSPRDYVIIDLMNELIQSNKYTISELKRFFIRKDDEDMSRQSKANLTILYDRIMDSDKIKLQRIEGNKKTQEVFTFLKTEEQLKFNLEDEESDT